MQENQLYDPSLTFGEGGGWWGWGGLGINLMGFLEPHISYDFEITLP